MLSECLLWTLGSAVKERVHEIDRRQKLKLKSGGNSWVRGDWDMGNELSWAWCFFSLFLFGEWLPRASCIPSIVQYFLPQNPETGLAFPQNYPDSSEVTLRVLFRARLESPKLVSCDTVAAVYERDLWSLLVSRWRWCFVKTAVMGQTSPCSVTELLQHEPLHIFYNVTLRSEIEPLNGTDSASAQTQMWMIGGPVIPIWCVLLCHCCSNSHFQKSNVCAI